MSEHAAGAASPVGGSPPSPWTLPSQDPAPPARQDRAARGILIALALSGPLWIAIGYAVWRLAADPSV